MTKTHTPSHTIFLCPKPNYYLKLKQRGKKTEGKKKERKISVLLIKNHIKDYLV